MSFSEDLGEVLDELSDPYLLPETMTWAGGEYGCFRGSIRRGGTLGEGGFGIEIDLALIVAASKFSTNFPRRGQTLSVASVTYRIESVETAPGQTFLRLNCVDASRGA